MTRHEPLPLWVGAICLLFAVVAIGAAIILIVGRAGPGERPADLTPTPVARPKGA